MVLLRDWLNVFASLCFVHSVGSFTLHFALFPSPLMWLRSGAAVARIYSTTVHNAADAEGNTRLNLWPIVSLFRSVAAAFLIMLLAGWPR